MKQQARPTLSPRQMEIAALVRRGRTSRQIGEALFIDRRTVETHIEAICKKLGVRTRVEMIDALFGATERASTDDLPANPTLPVPATSFVGRAVEVGDVAEMLASTRLVTLLGPGGIGKTRVALEVGAQSVDRFPDGVWFIELASLTRSEYLDATIAGALRISGKSTNELVSALSSKRALLIIDNCEHLVTHVAGFISVVLRSCRHLRICSTTRERLRVEGECIYHILPLPTPTAGVGVTANDADTYAAVTLFVERARAVNHRFALTDKNAMVVGDICRRLDGIPLAIELAAARASVLGLPEIRDRLPERLRLLTSGNSDAESRHQTLRGAFDWSHDLLQRQERALFRRLAIFVDTWTLNAAENICADETSRTVTILDLLSSLVEKSLVVFDTEHDPPRFRFLASTRVYAREQLSESREESAVADRHLRYYARLFEEVGADYTHRCRESTLVALALEIDEARAALDWALRSEQSVWGARLFAATPLWHFLGLHLEEMSRATAFLAKIGDEHPQLSARLWIRAANAATHCGRTQDAHDAARHACTEATKTHDRRLISHALSRLAFHAARAGCLDEADRALAAAEAARSQSGDSEPPAMEYRARHWESVGTVASAREDLELASRAFESLRDFSRSVGSFQPEFILTYHLAQIAFASDRAGDAIALLKDTLPRAARHARKDVYAGLLNTLAVFQIVAGEIADARRCAQEATLVSRANGGAAFAAAAIETLALTFLIGGDAVRAAKLAGYADANIAAHNGRRGFTETLTNDRLSAGLREAIDNETLAHLYKEAADMTLDEACALGCKIPGALNGEYELQAIAAELDA